MKILKIFICLFVGVWCMTACSGDDDNDKKPSGNANLNRNSTSVCA